MGTHLMSENSNLYILARYSTYSEVISSFHSCMEKTDSSTQSLLQELLEIFINQALQKEKDLI